MQKNSLGRIGEQKAKEYLIQKGLRFIASNFTFKKLEIDLIFEDKATKEIIFIEVKSRSSLNYGLPEEAIDEKKQANLRSAASVFIKLNPEFRLHTLRFDAVSVLKLNDSFSISHYQNAF